MSKQIIFLFSIILLASVACKKEVFEPEPQNNPEALFEELWTTFKQDYAPFEERGVDWDAQYQLHRPLVNSSTSEEELQDVFESMLRSLNDGHVSLVTPNADVFYSNLIVDQRIDSNLFDLNLVKNAYLNEQFLENGYGLNTYGLIGNIGYWHIGAIGQNMLEIDEILDYFADTDGLIVDMRRNTGGNFTFAFSEFGRFTDQERLVFTSKTKNGKGAEDYTDWYEWSIQPEAPYFNKNIVLLTDRYTISAGERTVMAFKTLPNVTHIGDTTNGAFSTKVSKELANGWFYSVATQIIQFRDGLSYEGTGMPPDIYTKNTSAEMNNGQDKTLEEALAQF